MNESSKATEAASYATTASEAWDWNESQLAELNRHLGKPFGEVERFNQALAFVLWKSGHPVRVWSENSWRPWALTDYPFYDDTLKYEVTPKPEALALPSIDWSHVTFDFIAQDEDGAIWGYDVRPIQNFDSKRWNPGVGAKLSLRLTCLTSLKPGKGDWKKLIVQRPEVV